MRLRSSWSSDPWTLVGSLAVKMKACTLEEVRAAKPEATKVFGRVARLAGVGITRLGAGYALKVNLTEPAEDPTKLPSKVNGVPVQVEVVGTIRKRDG